MMLFIYLDIIIIICVIGWWAMTADRDQPIHMESDLILGGSLTHRTEMVEGLMGSTRGISAVIIIILIMASSRGKDGLTTDL